MLAGSCKEGLGEVELKGIAPWTKAPLVTVAEAGLEKFVLIAFFLFHTALDSALKILFLSSGSLAMGLALYWGTVSLPALELSAILISLFLCFSLLSDSCNSSFNYSILLFSRAHWLYLILSCTSELNKYWMLLPDFFWV